MCNSELIRHFRFITPSLCHHNHSSDVVVLMPVSIVSNIPRGFLIFAEVETQWITHRIPLVHKQTFMQSEVWFWTKLLVLKRKKKKFKPSRGASGNKHTHPFTPENVFKIGYFVNILSLENLLYQFGHLGNTRCQVSGSATVSHCNNVCFEKSGPDPSYIYVGQSINYYLWNLYCIALVCPGWYHCQVALTRKTNCGIRELQYVQDA